VRYDNHEAGTWVSLIFTQQETVLRLRRNGASGNKSIRRRVEKHFAKRAARGQRRGCQRINPLEIAVPNKLGSFAPDPVLTNPDNPGISKCHCSNRPPGRWLRKSNAHMANSGRRLAGAIKQVHFHMQPGLASGSEGGNSMSVNPKWPLFRHVLPRPCDVTRSAGNNFRGGVPASFPAAARNANVCVSHNSIPRRTPQFNISAREPAGGIIYLAVRSVAPASLS